MYRKGAARLHLPQTCEEAGLLFARQGDREKACSLLGDALDGYERLGALRDVSRVEAQLRAQGVRRGRRGPRRRPATGWEALTDTEGRVAALLAEGLTNAEIADRLFISRRTVESHMAHILRKLGARSRTAVAAEALRRPR